AAGLARDDVRLADRVEELGLSVVDVTHDRDDRRTSHELVVALRLELGVQVDVEGPEQLAVLLLGRDHLDDVAELGREGPEGVLVERLRRRRHLAEVEQDGHEARGVRVDLVGEVVERGAVAQTHDGRAVPAGNLHAAERRRLHLLELLALRALRLAPADRTTAGAPEGALRGTTTRATAAAATGTTREAAAGGTATGTTAEAAATAAASAATARTATRGGTLTGTADGGAAGHHARVGTRTAGARSGTRPARTGTARTLAGRRRGTLGALGTLAGPGHALARRERVVARARGAGARAALPGHALARGERVVARPRRAGTRTRATGTGRGRVRAATRLRGRGGLLLPRRRRGTLRGGGLRCRGLRGRGGRG